MGSTIPTQVKEGKSSQGCWWSMSVNHDPKGNAKITIGSNYMPWENAQKCAELVEVAGYNYGEKYYREHHAKYPHWVIYGSETGSVVQSRGFTISPLPYPCWPMMTSSAPPWRKQLRQLGRQVAGGRIIHGAGYPPSPLASSSGPALTYIGEPTPYHTKNAYFGQLDTATFKRTPIISTRRAGPIIKPTPWSISSPLGFQPRAGD